MAAPRTLFDKIWETHLVDRQDDGTCLLYIDLHLVHEVTSPQAFEGLRLAGRAVRRPDATLAVADHNVPTLERSHGIRNPESRLQVETLERNVRAFGALAFGIGTSEVEHVLATQTLIQRPARNMRITVTGALGAGVTAKDVILAIIATIGTAGGTGHVIEYAGDTIRGLSMEGRMTLCNMTIEAGARAGLVAPDETTFAYLKGRPYAPRGAAWEQALAYWRTLPSDPGAHYDREVRLDAAGIAPFVTWGTSPQDAVPITGHVPDPDEIDDPARRAAVARALSYMGLAPKTPLAGIPVQRVFIGSCTNSRIEDL